MKVHSLDKVSLQNEIVEQLSSKIAKIDPNMEGANEKLWTRILSYFKAEL